jgi:predicted metal-binding protein
MLRAVEAGPQVVVCNTCRETSGALLAEALRNERAADPALASIAIEEMPCLFACSRSCAVHIRAPGKIGYVMGDFAPTAEAARAILTYARHHAASAEGEVRFDDWPEGVKGHFITRTPPEGFIVT